MTLTLVLLIVGILLLGIGLAQPLYVILGALSGLLLLVGTTFYPDFESLHILIEQTRELSDNEVLLAIPFFIIAGAVMSSGHISQKLVDFASVGFRGVPGALAISAVMGCVFFAAISGSSPVTVIAIGSILYPALIENKYNPRFSAGLLTSAGSLGILIPPSVPMIVYAIVDPTALMDPPNYNLAAEGQSTGLADLFLAGVGPGFMLGMIFIGASLWQGTRLVSDNETKPGFGTRIQGAIRGIGLFLLRIILMGLAIGSGLWIVILLARQYLPANKLPAFMKEGTWLGDFTATFWSSFWALMLPTIILGGIYSGAFTPTEAACVSVIYAVMVEVFIYRSTSFNKIPAILTESTILIGALLVILAVAQGFSRYLDDAEIPQKLVEFIIAHDFSIVMFLIVVNILLFMTGMLMDIMSAIIILVPLLAPVAVELGIHPIHLAVIFIVNLEIGYLTPPMGMNLFVASTIFRKSFGEMIRSALPFVGMMIAGLMIVTYVPTVSLGPVSYYNGHGFFVKFPEQRTNLRDITTNEGIIFLSRLADKRFDDAEEQEEDDTQDDGRTLTMAEITAIAQKREREAAVEALAYDNINDLLHDFERIQSGQSTMQRLMIERENQVKEELDNTEDDDDYDPYADDDDDDFDPYADDDDDDDFDPYADDDY